ncbi:MAG: hypothetical protein HYZ14_18940 [Bacteroidetes bacterium]|nr:hypothetical protein [Bacteroidota bacterium]
MKTLKIASLAFLVAGLAGCSGELAWKTDKNTGFYEIDVPERMQSTNELHAEASTQYEYISQEGADVKENYLIVLMETKESIDQLDLGFEFDALSYSELSIQALEGGLTSSEILTKDPKIEAVNGIDCVKIQMEGTANGIDVFYLIAIFEGEKAFYQVVTWTLLEQKDEFLPIMEKMVASFKETK